ncbi:hypothetical protein Pfo_013635 [Paulownia fortunei]|nr:hypothetical protein Pfo_013635 [Paulownia fortunei]
MANNLVMEEEEFMVSPTDDHVCFRTTHFLIPSVTSIDSFVAAPSLDFLNFAATCKRARILDAIMNSTSNIHRYDDLIFRFVEKWCPTTNLITIPRGEAIIMLEDMMVLRGYSVAWGLFYNGKINFEQEKIVKKLLSKQSNISKTKAKKVGQGRGITKFMGNRSEIEHEAFLAYWLCRFVFSFWRDAIGRSVLSIAVHLARGTKLHLHPPFLLAFARVWIWERFPYFAKAQFYWTKFNWRKFSMRPYTTAMSNVFPRMIHMDNEYWAMVDSDLYEDLEGIVRGLRTSELVSLEADCIEHYPTHCEAMQFDMDQDLPSHVARVNVNPEIAWSNYYRPIRDAKLYVPPYLSEPRVTTRHMKWWKKLNLDWKEDFVPPPPGFSPKWKRVESDSGISEQFQDRRNANFVPQQVAEMQNPFSSTANTDANGGLGGKCSSKSSKRKFVESSSWKISDYNARVSPPRFAPKHSQVKASASGIVIKKTVAELSSSGIYGNNQSQDDAQGKNHITSTANNGNIQEVTLSAEPAEASEGWIDGLDKKIGVSPSQVQSSISEAPGIRLEERLRNIEKLCAWLKAGKLVCL